MTTPLSPADVLRAVHRLEARDDRSRREIARLLGFDWNAAALDSRRGPPAERPTPSQRASKRSRSRSLPRLTTGGAPAAARPRAVSFTISGPEPARRAASTLPIFFPDFSRSDAGGLEPEPLFVPRWTRAILSTALAVGVRAGVIDLAETVRRVASGEALREWPRRRVGQMAPAVHLLIDAGENMLPFLADQVHITSELARVVGVSALDVLKFVGTPLKRAGRGPLRTWLPYGAPPPGTAVLLITDLGIGDTGFSAPAATVGDWIRFADLMRARACPVIALVPYAPARWPPAIARTMHVIAWDRTTTAGQIRFGARRDDG